MTGFLQRLAQRANGTARSVRAAPGTRFAPEPLGPHTPLQDDTPAPEPTTPFQPVDTTASTPPGASPGGVPDPVFALADAPRQPVLHVPRRVQSTPTAQAPAPLLAPADEAGAAPTSARAPRANAPTSNPPTPDPVDKALAARSVPPATGEPAAPRPDATPITTSPGSSTEAPPVWDQVEPLLSPVIRVRRPATADAHPLEPQRPGRGSRVEETTEVHVSIGRIEVTAIHEPAAPTQRPAARRKAPVSLDEYLARRQGGRS
ncbi:MAG: hypothetical protein A3G82_18955 [Burkholderiales bacterium RIFCSPLOWO2_12_FULL_67_210]|nr:MAG: hypothetical protein A3G82_18955 [Burkholderiales bacterium RIFCSPLOWO2_12_FULL_67_210]